MANIIDHSYFFGKLSIPQLDLLATQNAVNLFIDDYEPSFLVKLFGSELKELYLAGITANTQIYKDIRDGKAYTNRKLESVKWNGLKYQVGNLKKSLIANYVYYWYIRTQQTNSTSSGEKVTQSENARDASPRYKLVTAWNEMVEMCIDLREFLLSNTNIYSTYKDPLLRGFVYDATAYSYRVGGTFTLDSRQELFVKMNPYL